MGQNCIKPKNILKLPHSNENVPVFTKLENNENYNYSEILQKINDLIFEKYLNENVSHKELIAKAINKRPISKNSDDATIPKIPRVENLPLHMQFFTDYYTIDDLEDFLSNCSNSDFSPQTLSGSEDDEDKSLSEIVFSGDEKDLENLKNEEVASLLKVKKIHLSLAMEPQHAKKLTILLRKAARSYILEDVVDLSNDDGNTAISIAMLGRNIQAFYYLLMKCHADIPIFIYDKNAETPFLIYLAQIGKIKINKENDQVEYLLLSVLKKLVEIHPMEKILKHLNEVDKKTSLTLPHFLLYSYRDNVEIRSQIIECFKICIKAGPECANAMCINYYDPRFSYNLTANFITHPDLPVETITEFLDHLRKGLADKDKILLRELVKVHQDKQRKERLLQAIA